MSEHKPGSHPDDNKSFNRLMLEQIGRWGKSYLDWLEFKPGMSFLAILWHILTRLLGSILVIIFSPIIAVILLITFFAAG